MKEDKVNIWAKIMFFAMLAEFALIIIDKGEDEVLLYFAIGMFAFRMFSSMMCESLLFFYKGKYINIIVALICFVLAVSGWHTINLTYSGLLCFGMIFYNQMVIHEEQKKKQRKLFNIIIKLMLNKAEKVGGFYFDYALMDALFEIDYDKSFQNAIREYGKFDYDGKYKLKKEGERVLNDARAEHLIRKTEYEIQRYYTGNY